MPRPPLYTRTYILLCVYSRRASDKSSIHVRRTTGNERGNGARRKEKGGKDKRAQSMPLSMRRTVGPLSLPSSLFETSFEIKLNCPWIFTGDNGRDGQQPVPRTCITLLSSDGCPSVCESGDEEWRVHAPRRGLNACVHLLDT